MTNARDALLEVIAERFDAIDTKLPEKARDPMRCPEALLGHLAWSRGVDYWGDFPLATKRALANSAPARLRIRGTRGAIMDAIVAFQAELILEEWWEQVPEGDRGTATATIVDGSYVETDAVAQEAIVRLIEREGRMAVHCTLVNLIQGSAPIQTAQSLRVGMLYQFSGVQTGA